VYPFSGKNIYFMGFMAVGKTKVGSGFARFLGWPVYDTDDLIVEHAGKPISEIFKQDGEEAFRKLETDIIADLAGKQNTIVALGGGAVLRDENWEYFRQSGVSICLSSPVEVLEERISRRETRPLMAGLDKPERIQKILKMLQDREPYYRKADFYFYQDEIPVRDYVNLIFETLIEKL